MTASFEKILGNATFRGGSKEIKRETARSKRTESKIIHNEIQCPEWL
jgi:hypothetical protein